MREHTRRKNRVSYTRTIHYLTLFGKGNHTPSSCREANLAQRLEHSQHFSSLAPLLWNEKTGQLGSDSPIFFYVAGYCFLLRSSY